MSLPARPARRVDLDHRWVEMNETDGPVADACLHELVERAADSAPEAVALVAPDRRVTYGQLLRESAILAGRLRELGVTPESRVGICAGRSIPLAVAILGALRAGAAYVPLDPSYPRERLTHMLDDASPTVLLVQEGLDARLPPSDVPVVTLRAAGAREDAPAPEIEQVGDPEGLAYVIYTSGSTGAPKGISVRHRGVVNNLLDLISSHDIGPGDAVLGISSPSFDMCVFEILGALVAGATVVFPRSDGTRDPAHWAELIRDHEVTIWNSAPPLLDMLVTYTEDRPRLHPASLRVALLGGDWIPVELPDRLRRIAPGVTVVALGGATEASIHSIEYVVGEVDPDWPSIPYGRPMRNQRAYVLDEDLCPTAVGVAGELHIGGIGLARGYHRRPGMTAARFIPDPVSDDPGSRLYRTGDRARLLEDGNIELLGRMDHQVKVRGVRIDLGEVEAVLKTHPDVGRAVVVVMPDAVGDDRLVAHVVPAAREAPQAGRPGELIERWRAIYDNTYASSEVDATPDRDFSGWVSSYTGERFGDEELRESVDNAVRRILATNPQRVLEIGCGTGLVLFPVAPECEAYEAFDISPVVVERLRAVLADRPDLDHVRVRQGDALEALATMEPASVDLVVLNSVVQHFPGLEYLEDVVAGAARVVRPGGWVYLGDLRALPWLRTFHVSLAAAGAEADADPASVRRRAMQGLRSEKELFVDPALFGEMAADHDLGWAVALLRRGTAANEMNTFHLDVLLHAGPSASGPRALERRDGDGIDGPGALEETLGAVTGDTVLLAGIRNGRVAEDLALEELVTGPGEAARVMRDVRRLAGERAAGAPHPEALVRCAADLGWRAEAVWPEGGDPARFDLLVHRGDASSTELWERARLGPSAIGDAAQLANRPAGGGAALPAVSRLREHLASALPETMIPSAVVFLDEMPLSPNGKVDRTALPRPDDARSSRGAPVRPPRSDVERRVAEVWERVMGVSPIGLEDDFFDLGGHSLTATQIVSRLNESLGLEIPLRILFEHPTVEGLSRALESLLEVATDSDGEPGPDSDAEPRR